MSILTCEPSVPLVCVFDRDHDSLPMYRSVADGLGFRIRLFSSTNELREEVPLNRIMALILDVEADAGGAISLQRDLLQSEVPPSVILTMTDRYSEEVIESLGLGAIALLHRPWIPELMSQYLKFANLQDQELRKLHGRLVGFRKIVDGLTERQRAVLELAATGLPNKLIAARIEVSQRTVETERSKLLEAFGAESCAVAMIRYGEYGVLEQMERIRKRSALQRLGMHAATTMQEPFGAQCH